MRENREHQALLALLAHALFGRAPDIDAGSVNWAQVVAGADRHAVTALLYPGVKRMGGVPRGVVDRVRGAALTSAARTEDMLQRQQEAVGILREAGVPCAVLKGFSVACRYPYPELRLPGDIDLLVGEANMEAACRALARRGYARGHETDMHVAFTGDGVELEIHRRASLFPDNAQGRHARDIMDRALARAQTASIGEHVFPVLGADEQRISLLAHMERHMGSSGIGLRQICDWAATIHAHRVAIGEAELSQIERCGLLRFAKVITRLCERYLGLPALAWAQDAPDALVDEVMEDILAVGNFHAQGQDVVMASVMIDRVGEGEGRGSIVRSYVRHMRRRVRESHKWAKSPLWLPVFCVFYPIRWAYRVLRGRRRRVNLSEAMRIARAREGMLRRLKLYQRDTQG